MIIFNNPRELLGLYLKFNRIVFKVMIFLFLGVAALAVVGGFFFSFYKLFKVMWPIMHLDFSIVPQIFSILFNSVKVAIVGLWKVNLNLLISALCFYFYLKFILNLEALVGKIGESTFEKTFSIKENLEGIIVNLWTIQGLNIALLFIGPWITLEKSTKSDTRGIFIKMLSVLESVLDFVTLNFSGVTPLLFLLVIELVHRLSKKNDALEDEVGAMV